MAPAPNIPSAVAFQRLEQPVQSEYDDREYRAVVLENGMKVMVIHEAGLDKSCASLNVHVGHFCDPEDLQGAAHFLEHLLFLGTKKYPNEQEYFQYISSNGGHCNAFTQEEHTNYFFSIASEHLDGALDRLAQFFIAPLFNEDSTMREMNAVDSEHSKNIEQDEWRIHRLSTMKASPSHPLHKFGTGSMQTLNVEGVRQRIIDLYQKYYSSNLMSLVVYGSEPVDLLLKMVVDKFSAVPLNTGVEVPKYSSKPFDAQNVGTIMYVKPVKDLRTLTFTWQLPPLLQKYANKSEEYLTHLVGHEGQGSILECLRKKNLATQLSSYCDMNDDFTLFRISVELTTKGEKEHWQVAEAVFAYLSILRSQKVQRWIMEEWAQLAFMNFTFKEKSAPEDYALSLSKNMHIFPSKHVLNGEYVMESVDEKEIEELLKELDARNVQLMLVSEQFVAGIPVEHEQHYKASYQYQKIPTEYLTRLEQASSAAFPELSFPSPNSFIASDFKIKGNTVEYEKRKTEPVELIKNTVWFKQDDTFGLPKVNINVLFQHLKLFRDDVRNVVQAEIFCESFANDTASKFYSASLAGLRYRMIPSVEGIEIRFFGFHDKMPQFVKLVLDELFSFCPSKESFNTSLETMQRKYKNFDYDSPYLLTAYWLTHHLKRPSFSYVEKERESKAIKFSEFESFCKAISTESFSLKCLINGNLTSQDATKLVESVFKNPASLPSAIQITKLSPKQKLLLFRNVENLNNAVEIFFQVLPFENVKFRVLSKLYAQIFHEEFFHQVRTTEQFGYVSAVRYREDYDAIGVRFIVQSAKKHCQEIEDRIFTFIQSSLEMLSDPQKIDELFAKNVAGLRSNLLERHKSLANETYSFWNQIVNEQLSFTKNEIEASFLDSISKADLIEFVKSFLMPAGIERRLFSVWIVGAGDNKNLNVSNRVFIQQ